jgi:hypothetical protein
VSIQPSQSSSFSSTVQGNRRWLRCLSGLGMVAGLVAVVFPVPAAIALPFPLPRVNDYRPSRRDFDQCTSRLVNLKLSVEEATSACARALVPSDLSRCVIRVASVDALTATDALAACRQVRRPQEMASCVLEIHGRVQGASAAEVLDSCRRSLFPDRLANCVVGTSRAANYSPTQAINTCIDGGYFPRELDPTFISYPLVEPPEATQPPLFESPSPTPAPAPVTPVAPAQEVLPQRF